MLVFLRHAERGDNEFPQQSSEVPHDPPITSASAATIARTATQLLAIFQSNHIRTVQIICSKFLRCLMTAEQLGTTLSRGGVAVAQPSIVSNQIGEYMREDWFSEYPLRSGLIFDSAHRQKYIKGEEWEEVKLQQDLPFPENYVMFHHRVGSFRTKLHFPSKGHCTIIVTHGFVVREMCWRMNQVPTIMGEVPYCGYAVFTHDGQQEMLLKAKL